MTKDKKQQYRIVYKLQYAVQMKLKGHQLITTMPNPKRNEYQCWVFVDDQTFEEDLQQIIHEGRKHYDR